MPGSARFVPDPARVVVEAEIGYNLVVALGNLDTSPLVRLALAHAPAVGTNHTALPELTLYRFHEPTRLYKVPVNGVTLGVILQGQKRVRVGDEHFELATDRFLLVTRE